MIDAPKLSQIRTVWLEALFIFRPQGEDTLRGNPCVDAQIFPNPVSPVGGEVHFQDGIQWCFVTWWIEGFFNNFSLKALYRFYKNIQHLNRRQIISIEWATTPHSFNSRLTSSPPPHHIGRKYSWCIVFGDRNYKRIWFIDKYHIRNIKVFVVWPLKSIFHPTGIKWTFVFKFQLFIFWAHISLLIFYIWCTRVTKFFVWVCNFFQRSVFFYSYNAL